jgi:hypothetical protein
VLIDTTRNRHYPCTAWEGDDLGHEGRMHGQALVSSIESKLQLVSSRRAAEHDAAVHLLSFFPDIPLTVPA